ncbi:YcaO-like family protein (plasmid) [Rhizobium sp. CC1099]|uniref:YcaO-like family protein n=1 Tax=Rhizobium sp. CC1099 TaxID=3039160 RepID=UPI0024B0CCEE|nr:YcaO-like family protein [Rhizobium sp. CC1099]WFU91921.1 YcaO-like family protein [Rhizobium sp. CC1099]
MVPSETLTRVAPLLVDFGVTRVARHTGLDRIGIPVWCAYSPNARSIVVAQGKGLSDDDAKVSAVMEALERAVAGNPSVDTVQASARHLQESGYRVEKLNCLIGRHKNDIGNDEEIEWALGRELLSGTEIYIPFEAAILDRTRDCRFWMSSDGLASGNTLEEAMLHGMLERIERDAYVLWRIGNDRDRHSRCIDPRGLKDAALDQLIEKIETAGLVLRLFDMMSDIAVPCFTAILGPGDIHDDANVRFVEVTAGSGAHPSPVRAAIRAVTEAAQSRLTYISGARDDILPETFLAPLPLQTRTLFQAVPAMPATIAPAYPQSLAQHLDYTLSALRKKQIDQVIVLALSDPALPFSVAKIFIPALENPEGGRARRFGNRAVSKAIMS